MFCSKCGAENEEGCFFCRKCGARLPTTIGENIVGSAKTTVLLERRDVEETAKKAVPEKIEQNTKTKKKKTVGRVIAIVLAVAILALSILCFVEFTYPCDFCGKRILSMNVNTMEKPDGIILWVCDDCFLGNTEKQDSGEKSAFSDIGEPIASVGNGEDINSSDAVENIDVSDVPRHAPNMYVDWYGESQYDAVSIAWYCNYDATDTYWAVHNWATGYAGFQNLGGEHYLLLSLWDLEDGTKPTVEYSKDGNHGDFGGEGTGKQVFTEYDWQEGKWYNMKVEISLDSDEKMTFTQYIAEDGGDWEKCAAISYPNEQSFFDGVHVFQEDFSFTNELRACSLIDAQVRDCYTGRWKTLSEAEITNSYFPNEGDTWENGGGEENVAFDSYWEVCSWDDGREYIYIVSGGGGFEDKCELPATVTIE